MTGFPYRLAPPPARTFGLVVLQADQTIEADFRRLLPDPDTALFVSRVPSGAHLTTATIARMAEELPRAAQLFPKDAAFDAIGYACTSGTSLIGPARVEALIRGATGTRFVSTPLGAGVAAFRHLGAKRIGMVSPYTTDIADSLAASLAEDGIVVARSVTFGEAEEARVARIHPESITEAVRHLSADGGLDAIFLSCTNLQTLDIIGSLERETGLPVIGSNLALAWHMCQLAGRPEALAADVRLAII